jgi:putative endonuclease
MSEVKKTFKICAWEVYIIQAASGKLYTGITNHLERRFQCHLKQKKGARFFRFSKPEHILYRQACPDRSTASKHEALIKKMTRQQKFKLCGG